MVPSKVKEIKQSFRQMMDGSIAQSMRDKGLNYHLNWGATLPRLQEMAKEIANSQEPIANCQYDLAIALWKENVRECKILATMLMPADQILPEVVDIWMEQIPSQEIAEQLAFNLWQHLLGRHQHGSQNLTLAHVLLPKLNGEVVLAVGCWLLAIGF